jgi:hypothetical protein
MATYLKNRKDFKIVHLYENQFTIKCTEVYETEKEYYTYMGWKTRWEEYEDESRFGGLYYPSIVTLRVDLFTFLNNTYGTSYEVTDEMRAYADSFRGKLEDLYNIGIEVGWRFNDYGGFYHRYRFDTEEGRSLGVCESTYGEWTKEQLIGLADAIVEFFKTDPLAIAKEAMQKKYDTYNKIGIGHREDPLYSDVATGEFIPPKGKTTITRTMLK